MRFGVMVAFVWLSMGWLSDAWLVFCLSETIFWFQSKGVGVHILWPGTLPHPVRGFYEGIGELLAHRPKKKIG
jgi:hypothetical protein